VGAGSTDDPSGTWANFVAAIAVFLYSWCPIFIAVEISHAMLEPEKFETALKARAHPCAGAYLATDLT
jgi:hypothetical protein